MDEYIIGIDVGSSKVYAAVGKIENDDTLQILGVSTARCEGLNKGIVIDIEGTSESIRDCILQLRKMVDYDFSEAYLVIPSGICDLVDNKGVVAVESTRNIITEDDKVRAIEASKYVSISNDKEIVGVIPESYAVDEYDNIKDPVGMNGNKLEANVKVVTARTIVVNNLIKSVESAGLNVKGLELKSLAASRVILRKEEKNFGVALVDVGSETIDISVFKSGKLCYTSIVPFGGKTITSDLSVGLKISMDDAEKIKMKYGSLRTDNDSEVIRSTNINGDYIEINHEFMVDIIEARVTELVEFIKAELVNNGHFNSIEKVVLIGGGISYFNGIRELTEKVLNVSVRIGTPEYIGAASPVCSNVTGVLQMAIDEHISSKKMVEEKFLNDELYEDEDIYAERKGLAKRIKSIFSNLFS